MLTAALTAARLMNHSFISIVLVTLTFACACSEPQTPQAPPKPEEPPAAAPSVPTTPVVPQTKLIRDGIGVGGVEIGMTAETVKAKLGEPADTNKAGELIVYMSFHASEIFGVYFNDQGRVRMIIASLRDGTWCTAYDVCLYREGDLAKLKAQHGDKLLRFVDRDGSVTYRLLDISGVQPVMTEYTPVEEKNGVVQVAILYWSGPIDRSGFD